MNRNMLRRLAALEEQVSTYAGKVHMIFGMDADDLECKRLELEASAEWTEGDHVLAIRWVKAMDGRPAGPERIGDDMAGAPSTGERCVGANPGRLF